MQPVPNLKGAPEVLGPGCGLYRAESLNPKLGRPWRWFTFLGCSYLVCLRGLPGKLVDTLATLMSLSTSPVFKDFVLGPRVPPPPPPPGLIQLLLDEVLRLPHYTLSSKKGVCFPWLGCSFLGCPCNFLQDFGCTRLLLETFEGCLDLKRLLRTQLLVCPKCQWCLPSLGLGRWFV